MAASPDKDLADVSLGEAQYDSFVVRFLSRSETGDVAFGRVTHVGTRRSQAFRSTDELLDFMLGQIRPANSDDIGEPPVALGPA